MSVSIEDQIKCVEREIKMRARVYPRFIASGKMTPQGAEKEIENMKAVLETLKKFEKPDSQMNLL